MRRRCSALSPGKPHFNQALKVLNEPGLPEFTVCVCASLVNQGIPGKLSKPGYHSNQENQT